MRLAILVVVMAGCGAGDVREGFVGRWRGYETVTFTPSGGAPVADQRGAGPFTIREAEAENRIQVVEFCGAVTALVSGPSDAAFDPKTCPAYDVGGCLVVGSVREGPMVLNGDNLTIRWTGDGVVSGCELSGSGTWEGTMFMAREY